MGHPARAAPAAGEQAPHPPPPPQEEGQRAMPTPFLTKTYQLVEDPAIDDVISWSEDGSTFVVWRPAEFARDVLPMYFKHDNFSSFVRQLNTYGFRKIVPDRWEFANECFRRGEKRLLCDIHRRKISPTPAPPAVPAAAPPQNRFRSSSNSGDDQVLSANSSPEAPGSSGGAFQLAEENERLRRENKQLSRELGKMKSLCKDILQLISNYSPCRRNHATAAEGGGGETSTSPSPELVPRRSSLEEGSSGWREGPRLFGVSIGFKRNRGEDGGAAPDAKPEPVDGTAEA